MLAGERRKSAEKRGGFLLEAKLADAVRLCFSHQKPNFVGFLDEQQQNLTKKAMKQFAVENYMFWGGYPDAERVVFGVFPEGFPMQASSFPVAALTARFRGQDELSHRDFLGAFLAQGVQRSALGDFLLEPGRAVCFVRREMAAFFLSEVQQVGRTGVSLQEGAQEPFPCGRRFQEMALTVASLRLDGVVSACAGISRQGAAELIRAGKVYKNQEEMGSLSTLVREGDTLSIRGVGKFRLEGPDFARETKKHRLRLPVKKYI